MVYFKKVYRDELLQLAIILSLLGADRDPYRRGFDLNFSAGSNDFGGGLSLENAPRHSVNNRNVRAHPKSMDSILLSYERDVLEDLNALGRYNRIEPPFQDVTAYVLNVNSGSYSLGPVADFDDAVASGSEIGEPSIPSSELTQEDMDLIEVLWKQDVDLGFSEDNNQPCGSQSDQEESRHTSEELEKLEVLKGLNETKPKEEAVEPETSENKEKPWPDNVPSVDVETGENSQISKQLKTESESSTSDDTDHTSCSWRPSRSSSGSSKDDDDDDEDYDLTRRRSPSAILTTSRASLKSEAESSRPPSSTSRRTPSPIMQPDGLLSLDEDSDFSAPSSLADLPDFSLEETLDLVGFEDPVGVDIPLKETCEPTDELDLLGAMLQTASVHSRSLPGRIPYGRGVSTEQRWQDLASLLSLQGAQGEGAAAAAAFGHPFPPSATHQPHHNYGYDVSSTSSAQPPRSVVLHNATLAPPMGDLNSSAAYQGLSMGSAVATSMSLNLNSSEPMGDSAPPSACKMEASHDMLYYQNSSTSGELGQLGPLGQLGHLGQLNSTTEGFLSSILEDSDLQLTMDMAMNEGMYPMRMLESNSSNNASSIAGLSMGSPSIAGGPLGVTNMTGATGPVGSTEERLDASSDSAVSSMGSERVASLSDGGEWMETGSDSGHTANDHYHLDYSHSKYRPHEYGNYMVTPGSGEPNHRIQQPVAQKKHQMYGKRYFQGEQAGVPPLVGHGSAATPTSLKYEYGEASPRPAAVMPGSVNMGMGSSNSSAFTAPLEDDVKTLENKYSCGLEFARQANVRHSMEHVAHNHSYHLPPLPESPAIVHHPVTRDKPKGREGRKSEDSHLTRDEKRARALNVPISVDDIINLPMDEFNERLSKFDLSEAQLSLIRDIRRRGKNKVAAQNCRKRKLDQIVTLADEVQHMREMKQQLTMEHDKLIKERARMKEKFSQLYSHVFQNLRDPDGNPYSVYEYSLQQSSEGTVVLVPRTSNSSTLLETPSQLGAHPHPHSHSHSHTHPHTHPHSQSHQLPHHNIPHQLPHGHGHTQSDRHKEHLPHHSHPHPHSHQPHPHSHHKE